MTVHIETFAVLKDIYGNHFQLEAPVQLSVGSLRQQIEQRYPAASTILKRCRIAHNDTFVPDDYLLSEQEVYLQLIPPSSGG